MKIVKIKAYKYAELNEEAKATFINEMYNCPFAYDDEDEEGNTISKNDYFGRWDLSEQIDFCDVNGYLFDKRGGLIGHLIVDDRFGPEEDFLDEDVQSLVSQIISTLQYDCGYLKPQPISTAGNKQGDGIYNWEAYSEIENICREFNITKRSQK